MKHFLPIILLLILPSCDSLMGDEGPPGPPGPAGPSGVSVVVFTLSANAFDNGSTVQQAIRTMPEITSAVIERGAVLAYTDIGTGNDTWTALPFTLATGSTVSTLTYVITEGGFSSFILKNTSANLSSLYAGFRIRVVIIAPDGTASP